jgi:hypothetical protein
MMIDAQKAPVNATALHGVCGEIMCNCDNGCFAAADLHEGVNSISHVVSNACAVAFYDVGHVLVPRSSFNTPYNMQTSSEVLLPL